MEKFEVLKIKVYVKFFYSIITSVYECQCCQNLEMQEITIIMYITMFK